MPLLSDRWKGSEAPPAELRSDCPWYADDADGALKAVFSPSAIKTTTTDTNKVKGGGFGIYYDQIRRRVLDFNRIFQTHIYEYMYTKIKGAFYQSFIEDTVDKGQIV